MAQKYLVQVIDDLDGSELDRNDAQQVHFSLDGTAYVIDLSTSHAATLRDLLGRYATAARRDQLTARAEPAKAPAARAGRRDLDQVRAWAGEHGYTVSPRGRVPAAVLQAYDAR